MTGIMFNEDDSHFAYELDNLLAGEEPNEKNVASFLDQYANTSVKEMLLCVNAQRTGFATNAEGWEPIWEELETGPDWWRNWPWPKNNKRLIDAGIDRFAVQLARCRELDISPWLSIRTNDMHAVDDLSSPMHSWFWKQNHDCWRVPERFEQLGDRALNYAKPAVRKRLVALVRDVAERYDFDGLEIDWIRTEYCLPPGREWEDAHLITEMMTDIRAVLDEKGQRDGRTIELSVRVPPHPEQVRAFGFDVLAWAREGIVQRIVPAPHIHLYYDIPVELWKHATAGTGVLICPGLDIRVQPHLRADRRNDERFFNSSSETTRGAAVCYLDQGADRIYLFNHFCNGTNICDNNPDLNRQLMTELGDLEQALGRNRRHLITHSDVHAPGYQHLSKLPTDCGAIEVPQKARSSTWPYETASFRLWTGPKPQGQNVLVRLAYEADDESLASAATVHVNQQTASFAGELTPKPSPGAATKMWQYQVPEEALYHGPNLVEVNTQTASRIVWVELAFVSE